MARARSGRTERAPSPEAATEPIPTIEMVALVDIREYANNPRQHSIEQIESIAASIQEYSFTNPCLIDGNNELIAGHGRLEAAKLIHMTHIPCIRLRHLSPEQKRALVIADNKIAITGSQWDIPLLKSEILALSMTDFKLEKTGFSLAEVSKLFEPLPEIPPRPERHIQASVVCPHCGHEFDA